MTRISFRNFTGGEVTPSLSARYDLQKAGTFLLCCENFIPRLHGDIERRPGTRCLAELSGPAVLVPFRFNTEAANNHALIFSEGRIRVAGVDGVMPAAGLESDYAPDDVYGLSVAQVGDVVYLAHRKYPLRRLTRSGSAPDYVWTLEDVALNRSLPAPAAPSVAFVRGNADDKASLTHTLRYVVTAVDAGGTESLPSPPGEAQGKFPTDWVVGNHVTLSWSAVPGAAEYNVYRESAGYYGLIGVAAAPSFSDQNFEADTSITPKEDWNPFADGNHPGAVTFHQQRMVLGGTRDNPASFYMSRSGDYENFRKSRPLQDDDPVEYMLASGSIDDITWIASFGDLLIGTSGAEYKAASSGPAITPADVRISVESYWGSSGLQPIIIGNSILHCQRGGSHVRDLRYSWENDGYAGNDLSLLAPQLVEGHGIRQWAFQQSPGSTVWAARDDGLLLCLTYMQEQNVYAWSRHVTAGKALSVISLSGSGEDGGPGNAEDVILMVVERDIGGVKKYFLERLARRFRESDDIAEAFFVDCGVTRRFDEPVTEVGGLDHLEGAEVAVLADGSPEEGHIVKNGTIRLLYPARVVHAGLPFRSVLAPLPVETDTQSGSTLGRRRAYGRCALRLFRSAGGAYAATEPGDLFDPEAWKKRHFYDIPLVPDRFGEAVRPFSGDVEIALPAGQDNDTSIWIMQDRPMPFRLVAIGVDVDFGEV